MKTSELMIGDWVLHEGEPYQIRQFGIYGVDIGKPTGICLIVERNEIEPIPLSPEILEKNGFYWGYTSNEYDIASSTIASLDEDDKGWVWDEGGGAVKIQFPTNSDGGVIVADDQSFDRFLTLHFCNDIYVHELQHIFKLCKINKEIVL